MTSKRSNTLTVCSLMAGFVSVNPWTTWGKICELTAASFKYWINCSICVRKHDYSWSLCIYRQLAFEESEICKWMVTCCKSRILIARSVEENIFTMTGIIFCWYSSADKYFPTWGQTSQRTVKLDVRSEFIPWCHSCKLHGIWYPISMIETQNARNNTETYTDTQYWNIIHRQLCISLCL